MIDFNRNYFCNIGQKQGHRLVCFERIRRRLSSSEGTVRGSSSWRFRWFRRAAASRRWRALCNDSSYSEWISADRWTNRNHTSWISWVLTPGIGLTAWASRGTRWRFCTSCQFCLAGRRDWAAGLSALMNHQVSTQLAGTPAYRSFLGSLWASCRCSKRKHD